uniref:LYR motif containing 4 n=1 Tax=Gallus gallus TaxID=9031 RepID=A0A8V0YBJ8_CHICK
MAASSRAQVLRLYRALLRESQRFSGYNYRTYAIRRIRDAFRENKSIKDSEKIEELVNKAKENLEIIHRLLSARCMPHRNWSLRVPETHSCERALTLKQPWTIFSIFQRHIQMRNITAHLTYSVQQKKCLRDSVFGNQSTIFLWFAHPEIHCCDLQ